MLMIDLDPVSKHQRLLREIPFDFGAQRPFPGTAEHHVKNGSRRRDDNQKDRQQFEEDAVLQDSSTGVFAGSESYRDLAGAPSLSRLVRQGGDLDSVFHMSDSLRSPE